MFQITKLIQYLGQSQGDVYMKMLQTFGKNNFTIRETHSK